jgi:solute carrier family 35 protein
MYLILVEKSGAEDGLSSVDLMFYNSILSLPFLFFVIIATGEFPHSLTVLSAKVSDVGVYVRPMRLRPMWPMYGNYIATLLGLAKQ